MLNIASLYYYYPQGVSYLVNTIFMIPSGHVHVAWLVPRLRHPLCRLRENLHWKPRGAFIPHLIALNVLHLGKSVEKFLKFCLILRTKPTESCPDAHVTFNLRRNWKFLPKFQITWKLDANIHQLKRSKWVELSWFIMMKFCVTDHFLFLFFLQRKSERLAWSSQY